MTEETDPTVKYCSFCSEPEHAVALLIEGSASAFICEDCVAGCVNILADRHRLKSGLKPKVEGV